MDLSLVPYVDLPAAEKTSGDCKYRECLRNHAAAMGGQAYDGCGEFMAGEDESLKCAACGCHRNFHRREGSPTRPPILKPILKHAMVPAPSPVAFFPPPPLPFHQIPPPVSPDLGRGASETPPRREEGPMRKRYRTKFSAEQKEKMWIFAEKLGWRIQKHDGEKLEEFCVEIGVKRHALKVWMHNHKNNLSSSAITTSAAGLRGPPPPPPAPAPRRYSYHPSLIGFRWHLQSRF
ncbi:zinc-finger homeodomain protein 8-like [Phalaenopsis equestris]|uniref:zinc-finger homeodomain protein 8-like n=1 Tax=Phalaenopsis equestris TaxID=78828 RepID=UPI0009E22345|nr:zinc-finger homeodomain protein 8-like [Phalaenopsis equestris]